MKAKSTPWLKQHSIKNECTFRVSFILFLISFLICSQPPGFDQGETLVFVILLSDCLQYSNSAINPVLYAFLSDNFKKSFRKACHCDKREGTGGLGHIQDCSATTRYNFSSYLNFKSHFLRLLPSLLIFLKICVGAVEGGQDSQQFQHRKVMMKTRRVEIYQPESHLHQGVASTTAVPGPLSDIT